MALKGERGVTSAEENLYSEVWALVEAGGGKDCFWTADWPEEAGHCMTSSWAGAQKCGAARLLQVRVGFINWLLIVTIPCKGRVLGLPAALWEAKTQQQRVDN